MLRTLGPTRIRERSSVPVAYINRARRRATMLIQTTSLRRTATLIDNVSTKHPRTASSNSRVISAALGGRRPAVLSQTTIESRRACKRAHKSRRRLAVTTAITKPWIWRRRVPKPIHDVVERSRADSKLAQINNRGGAVVGRPRKSYRR